MPLISHENDDSPAGMRASFNSLLFSCALFVESCLLVQKLNKHFWQMSEFQALSKATNKSKEAQELLNSGLFDLRNRLVFHFDVDEIGKQLKDVELAEPIFALGMGDTNGQVYYELGDLCAVRAFCGPSLPKDDAVFGIMEKRLAAIADLITEFATTAEAFMLAVLKTQGWHGVTR
jgi:hypothetical protein